MTRSQLKSIIQEIVYRKLSEQSPMDMGGDASKTDTSPEKDISNEPQLSEPDKAKLAEFEKKSKDLSSKIEKIKGNKSELESMIQPKIQKLDRELTKLQEQLSDVIKNIESIKKRAK